MPRWTQALGAVRNAALDLLFTPRCVACGREGRYLCDPCLAEVPRLATPYRPPARERGQAAIEAVHSPFAMDGVVRRAVHELKYRGVRALAAPLSEHLRATLERRALGADLLVPVPLHPRRLRQRGYNQAELLAREVARHSGLPCDPGALQRLRHDPPQARAPGLEARWEHAHGAFRATRPLEGRHLLLVDDVCTTGATLDACARAARKAGARSVLGLTVAREL